MPNAKSILEIPVIKACRSNAWEMGSMALGPVKM
jgi:hypothetical protein